MKGLVKFGIGGSAIYLLAFAAGVLTFVDTSKPLTLNEAGDFLSGAFAPLAFLWLVLGYFQQGRELQNSAESLRIQAEELRNSVEQSSQLVEVTRKQYLLDQKTQAALSQEAKNRKQPILRLQSAGSIHSGNSHEYKFSLFNAGSECRDVIGKLILDGRQVEGVFPRTHHLQKEGKVDFVLRLEESNPKGGILSIEFTDLDNETSILGFAFVGEGSGHQYRLFASSVPKPLTDC